MPWIPAFLRRATAQAGATVVPPAPPAATRPASADPECVYLDLTWTCNLRCVQCAIHELRNPADELSLEERGAIIQQVGDWNPAIRMVLSGGELFTRKEALFSLAAIARDRGIYLSISTNGTLVSREDAGRLPTSGIRYVAVSLDSHDEATHDYIRGVPGTFQRAVRAIQWLVAARDSGADGGRLTVATMSILGRHNLDRLAELAAFAEGLGVDQLLFQPIQPVFARPIPDSWWVADPLFPIDGSQVDRGMDTLRLLRSRGRPVALAPAQLELFRSYLKSPATLPRGLCASGERNLMVDLLGNVRLCFNMERAGLAPVAHVRERSLQDVWCDPALTGVRSVMSSCREACGCMMVHCG
jgi:MoaA/NifB/PqqE/SkfB family radical SAM enzyme